MKKYYVILSLLLSASQMGAMNTSTSAATSSALATSAATPGLSLFLTVADFNRLTQNAHTTQTEVDTFLNQVGSFAHTGQVSPYCQALYERFYNNTCPWDKEVLLHCFKGMVRNGAKPNLYIDLSNRTTAKDISCLNSASDGTVFINFLRGNATPGPSSFTAQQVTSIHNNAPTNTSTQSSTTSNITSQNQKSTLEKHAADHWGKYLLGAGAIAAGGLYTTSDDKKKSTLKKHVAKHWGKYLLLGTASLITAYLVYNNR